MSNAHSPASSAAASPAVVDVVALQQQIAALQVQLQQQQQQQPAAAAAAAVAHASLPQLPRMAPMSKFKGQMGSALDNWERELRQHFDYYAHMLHTDAAQVKYASANLQEGALLHYQAGLAHNVFNSQSTFADFMQHMRKRYRPVDAARQARARLASLHQQHGVSAYTEAFQATLAHISDMGVSDQVFSYVKGLRKEISLELQKKWPSSLDEAIATAIALDSATHSAFSSGATGFRKSQWGSNGSAPMDLSQVEEEEAAAAAAATSPQDGSAMAQMLAKMEQMEAKLNNYSMQGKYQGQPPPRRQRIHVEGISASVAKERLAKGACLACGEVGHWKGECTNVSKLSNSKVQGKQ